MEKFKQINIKNRTYYFFNDIVDIKNFHSNLLEIDIYYIGYITIEKVGDCENIHSVNLLYLIIHSAAGHFKEKNGEKYLIIDSTEKYKKVFSGIRSEIKTLNGGKELFYEKNYVLQNGEKLYWKSYLDKCLYELVKVLEYDRIDISEWIDIKKTNISKECKICHYWYFKNIGFKYEPYLCNGCHGLMMLLLFMLKGVLAEFAFGIWVKMIQLT